MQEKDFLEKLEEIMDLEEGQLSMDAKLDDYEEWDSLSALGLTMFAKKELDKVISTEDLQSFVLVKDVYNFCYGE